MANEATSISEQKQNKLQFDEDETDDDDRNETDDNSNETDVGDDEIDVSESDSIAEETNAVGANDDDDGEQSVLGDGGVKAGNATGQFETDDDDDAA